MNKSCLHIDSNWSQHILNWRGRPNDEPQSIEEVTSILVNLDTPVYVLLTNNHVILESSGEVVQRSDCSNLTPCIGIIPSQHPRRFGDPTFIRDYGLQYAYLAGAMANGINSEEMVTALGKKGFLSSFGAGGLSIDRIEQAIIKIKSNLPNNNYAINLLHNPSMPAWETECVNLFVKHGVRIVEASAYLNLSPAIVYYRVSGLERKASGIIERKNKIIAKVSRIEVARQFMQPAPQKILKRLLKKGLISDLQVELANSVPMADDITVEGTSGGHTDSGVLTCIFPSIVKLRNEIQSKHNYQQKIRIGAAGGIGDPQAVSAAFAMGAAYIVTGSINQVCAEAGTSESVKKLLSKAKVTDVALAPSADMFEIGAKVQVLKTKTMYSIRAQKLYSLYKEYDAVENIKNEDLTIIEQQFFKKTFEQVWDETVQFFKERNMHSLIATAEKNSKKKMALIFQWYLGQSSEWAKSGTQDRLMDYQIWCGPSMGACNEWLAGTPLENYKNRKVADIALYLMHEAAYFNRIQFLKSTGVHMETELEQYNPNRTIKTINADYISQSSNAFSIQNKGGLMNSRDECRLDMKYSKEFFKQCWELLPGGAHYNFADPNRPLVVPFKKGRNSRCWDLDDNEHLDLFCKFGALFLGHHNKEYNDAIINYMHKVTSVDVCNLEYEVCDLLTKHIPCAEMVRFGLSGTEAVQNALRLARAATGKNRFIRFHGHYHGNADNIMGWRKKKDLSYPIPEPFKGDMLETLGRAKNILEEQSFVLPWNEIEILENTIANYEDEIGAVIMEPICFNGGGILPKDGYLEHTKEICEKYNVVLIFDEIITGIRLSLGGAQEILGVTPHLATFGKALGGGSMPISAIAGKKEIMNLYTKGKVIHAGTFNGYPLGLAAIKATFNIIERDPNCYERIGGIMAQISEIFIKAAKKVDIPMVVQGMPTALVYHSQDEFVEKSEGYSDLVKYRDILIREICKHYGIQFSPLSRIYGNLLMNQEDVQFFKDRIFNALEYSKKMLDLTFKGENSL